MSMRAYVLGWERTRQEMPRRMLDGAMWCYRHSTQHCVGSQTWDPKPLYTIGEAPSRQER